MRRSLILAFLACGALIFSGCGSDKKETADNSSNTSQSSDSSNRPSRSGGGGAQKSSSTQKAPAKSSNDTMSGDPERRNGQDPNGGSDQMGDMMAKMQQQRAQREGGGAPSAAGGGQPQKPDYIPQAQWDKMSASAKQRAGAIRSGGGGARAGSGGSGSGGSSASGSGQLSGDPRMNNGGASGDQEGQNEQMDGDPRMRNGGSGFAQSGQEEQMDGDPRMRGNSGGGGAGSAAAPDGGFGGAGSASAPGGSFGGPGGPGFGGPNQQAKAEPKTLKEKALKAFQDGDDDGGFQYMYGHYVAEDEGRSNISLQMMPTARRPRVAMRWGIGVVFKHNKGFTGDPPKIGEKPNVLPQGRSSRSNRGGFGGRGGAGGFGGSGGGAPGTAGDSSQLGGSGGFGGFGGGRNSGNPANGGMDELLYYTGEVGEKLVGMIDKIRTRGNMGRMIAKVSKGDGGQTSGRSGVGTFSGGSGGGATIDDGRSAADRNRFRSGGGSQGFRQNSQAKPADSGAASPYKNVLPGVLMLGKGTLKSLTGRAKAHGIDVLVLVEVNCKLVPSNGQKINDTKVMLYDVTQATPARVGKPSTMLNNIRVWMARQKGELDEDNDPVHKALRNIFEPGKEDGFLAMYKLTDMPELNQEQVMNRLKSLIAEGQASGNPMPAMVELTYYRQKGLLPEKAYVDSLNKLAGSDIGEILLNGEEEQRVKALESLLPPEWKVNEAAAGEDSGDEFL